MKSPYRVKSRWLLLCAVACASASSVATAQVLDSLAAPDQPFGPAQPGLRDLVFDSLADVVNFRRQHPLSTEQQVRITSLLIRHRDAIVEQARARLAAQRVMRAAIEAADQDETAIRAAAQHVGSVIGDGAVLHRRLAAEIQPLLTAGQRTAWHELLARMEDRLDAFLAPSL